MIKSFICFILDCGLFITSTSTACRATANQKPRPIQIDQGSEQNSKKVAILGRKKSKLSTVGVDQKKGKSSYLHLLSTRIKRSLLRSENAFGKFQKFLHKSMTIFRRQFYENYLKTFFKATTQSFRKLTMATKQQVGIALNTKETSDVDKPSVIVVALNLFHRFLCLCVRFVLVKVHGEHGPSMAPIEDLLLLESATSIAEKIRTKKVIIYLRYYGLNVD